MIPASSRTDRHGKRRHPRLVAARPTGCGGEPPNHASARPDAAADTCASAISRSSLRAGSLGHAPRLLPAEPLRPAPPRHVAQPLRRRAMRAFAIIRALEPVRRPCAARSASRAIRSACAAAASACACAHSTLTSAQLLGRAMPNLRTVLPSREAEKSRYLAPCRFAHE